MHLIVKVFHCLPEPNDDTVVGSVAIGIDCVLTPILNADLSKTTKEVLEERGRERGWGGEREREREREMYSAEIKC